MTWSKLTAPLVLIPCLALCAFAITLSLRAPSSFKFPLFGDGHYYFAQTESLLRDADLDLDNQLALLGDPLVSKISVTRGLGNSLLWAPFYAIGALWGELVSDDPKLIALHAAWGCRAGTLFYLLWSLCLLYRWPGLAAVSGGARAFALAALALGTPLWRHTFTLPLYNHVLTFFCVTALLYVAARVADERHRTAGSWLGLGALIGLALTTRPETCVFALPALLSLRKLPRAAALRAGAQVLGVAALPVLAQLVVFARSGTSVAPPAGFLDWTAPQLLALWFSPRNGFFAQQPLLWLAALGYVWLARRQALLWTSLAALVFCLVQSCAWDVWGGFGFGARRMIPLLPLAYLGTCELARAALARSRAGALVLASCVAWASWHSFATLDVARAAAIDDAAVPPESAYTRAIGVATSVPFIATRALQVGASLEQTYRIAFRSTLTSSLARSRGVVDVVDMATPRGRDLALDDQPGAYVLPLERAPLCAIGFPDDSTRPAIHLDGERLADEQSIGGHRVFMLSAPLRARWIRIDVTPPATTTQIVLDGRCR